MDNELLNSLMNSLFFLAPQQNLDEILEAQSALDNSVLNRPIIVYRVEDSRDRRGPYRTSEEIKKNALYDARARLSKRLTTAHNNEQHQDIRPIVFAIKNTYKDGKPRAKAATRNLKTLRNWFDGFGQDLKQAGYVIGAYMVKQAVDWRGQVVFNPTLSRRVGELPIDLLK